MFIVCPNSHTLFYYIHTYAHINRFILINQTSTYNLWFKNPCYILWNTVTFSPVIKPVYLLSQITVQKNIKYSTGLKLAQFQYVLRSENIGLTVIQKTLLSMAGRAGGCWSYCMDQRSHERLSGGSSVSHASMGRSLTLLCDKLNGYFIL